MPYRSLIFCAIDTRRIKIVNIRSLALLVFIFAASAALAAYIGIRYDQPVPEHQVQRATPPASPAPVTASTTAAPAAMAKPETSVVSTTPARDTTQPMTLQSAPERKPPQAVQLPARNTMELSGSNTVGAARPAAPPETEAPKCNKDACANAYPRSFDAGDCTYQPTNGPRRLCKK